MSFKVNEDILKRWEIELQRKLITVAKDLITSENKFKKRTLYHYTNLSGLKGIIENQNFYLSNSAFLNDKEEFQYGINLFKGIAEELLKNRLFIKNKNLIRKIVDKLSKTSKSNRYVTCFSFEGDLLSQWRAYSDDGKGISIGFDLQMMKKAFKDNADGFFIVYEKKQQFRIASKILQRCVNFYCLKQAELNWSKKSFNSVVPGEILKLIDQYIGQFKHSSFSEENEYRYEVKIDEDVQNAREILFRIGKNGILVPHLLLQTAYRDEKERRIKENKTAEDLEKNRRYKVKRFPITEIIIGPSIDHELNSQSIFEFLKKHNYRDVIIKKSNVPYRI